MNKLLSTIINVAITGIVVSLFLDTNLGKKVEKGVVNAVENISKSRDSAV